MTPEQIDDFINRCQNPNKHQRCLLKHSRPPKPKNEEGKMLFVDWLMRVGAKYYCGQNEQLYGLGWVSIELMGDRIIIETANTTPCVFSYNEIEEAKEKAIELYEQLDKTSIYHRIFK